MNSSGKLVFALIALIVLSFNPANAVTIPSTPAGKCVEDFIRVFNTG